MNNRKTYYQKLQTILDKIKYDDKLASIYKNYINFDDVYTNQINHLNNLLKNNAELMYKIFKDYTGHCDIYPEGILNDLMMDYFNHDSALYLKSKNLIDIDFGHFKFYSNPERQVFNSLSSLFAKYEYKYNDRSQLKTSDQLYEIDFYFPTKNIGIEVSPNFYHHSNKYNLNYNLKESKDEYYHYNKYKLAEEKNINLIQLFSYDLVEPVFTNITIPRINRLFNHVPLIIDSKDITLNNITKQNNKVKNIRNFIDEYHHLGKTPSNYKYEIIYEKEVIGGILLKKLNSSTVDIKRYCTEPDFKINNILNKLCKQIFIDYPKINTIKTYSDNSFDDDNNYIESDFTYLGETRPSLKFVNPSHPLDRYSWQITMNLNSDQAVVNQDRIKKGLKPYYEEKFNVRKYVETELSHRQDNSKGYDVIYTPGSKKWEIKREDVIK